MPISTPSVVRLRLMNPMLAAVATGWQAYRPPTATPNNSPPASRRHVPPAQVPVLRNSAFDLMIRSAFISQVPTEPKRPTARRDARRIGPFVRRCDCPRHHGRQPLRLCGREHNLLHLRRFQCLPRVTNVMACRSWKLQAERPVFHMREPSGINSTLSTAADLVAAIRRPWPLSGLLALASMPAHRAVKPSKGSCVPSRTIQP